MRESPAFERTYRQYRSQGVEFVGVQVEKSAEDARKFLKNHEATYPAGLDPDLAIANRFGFQGTPYTVIIDRKGAIAARVHGPAGADWLNANLAPLLKGR